MTSTSRRWVLASTPNGEPKTSDFEMASVVLPPLREGGIIVRNTFISVDPGVLDRLTRDSYAPQLRPGEVVDGFTVGVVTASQNPRFEVGDRVTCGNGWRESYVSSGRGVMKLHPKVFGPPISERAAIGALGVSGLTAYFGVRGVAQARSGETVLVSSAAGAVGSTAIQVARNLGCRVVGIAGSEDKARLVVEDLGAEACIDYRKEPDLSAAIARTCPDGVDVFFDNVGGKTLDAALLNMSQGGRVAISGQVSEYSRVQPRGIRAVGEFINRRITMTGFVVWDFLPQFREAMAEMRGWMVSGQLVFREEIIDGFENAPAAFVGLFRGENRGRRLIRLASGD
ncbi:MAG: NADP-dependent oxidoreductase [bacterium]|nr:NADP-dependent oxidoreductase [Acidimicrobiia bacterium]MCY4650058.1 NADP-dependent oxidoreductase [bacterium]